MLQKTDLKFKIQRKTSEADRYKKGIRRHDLKMKNIYSPRTKTDVKSQ